VLDWIVLTAVLGVAAVISIPLYAVLLLPLPVAYFVMLEGGSSGQTVGKRALNIRVVDESTGGPIGFGRGFMRYLTRLPSIFLSREYREASGLEDGMWHDGFTSTVVVRSIS
jgi:uncharacterized RDD family membrane protein YckC